MTITGASINSALIAQLKPDVVLVEEAAEAKSSETSPLLTVAAVVLWSSAVCKEFLTSLAGLGATDSRGARSLGQAFDHDRRPQRLSLAPGRVAATVGW